MSCLGFRGLGTGRSLEFDVRRLRMRLDLWLLKPMHEACNKDGWCHCGDSLSIRHALLDRIS